MSKRDEANILVPVEGELMAVHCANRELSLRVVSRAPSPHQYYGDPAVLTDGKGWF